jgi:hypothetical protein
MTPTKATRGAPSAIDLPRRAAGGLLAVLVATTPLAKAFAQIAPAALPAPTPAPSAPVAQGSTDVPYPPGAKGDAIVLLELVVEKDGSVASAVVTEGASPFAEQARSAVLTWRFAPALAGDMPVAARIRARVDFHEPPAPALPLPVSPAPAPPTASAAPAPAAAPEALLEATVRGHRREAGQTTLSAIDVREMPGAFGDPFRAVEALPGVSPMVSGLPFFYVRGAPPNDNAYTLDGIRVPLLFHVGIGQGVLHPGLVDRVDFYPGVAPARHGGAAGGVIAGQTRAPASAAHGEANLRLFDAGALLESPFGDGRGTALVAGRFGYPGPILSAVTPDVKLGYWDYQARTTWRIGDRGTLGLFGFGSHDFLAARTRSMSTPDGPVELPLDEKMVSDFHRLDLRYDHALADGHLRFAVTGGHDRQGAAPTYITDRSLAARLEIDHRLWPALRIRGGATAQVDDYGFEQGPPIEHEPIIPSSADPPPTNLNAGLHADVVWRPAPRIEIVPGARFDVFSSRRADAPGSTRRITTTVPAFDPRLSARVTIAPGVAWLSAFGQSHQYPALRVGNIPAPILTVPGLPVGDTQLQIATQASQGIELALPAELVVSATGFLSHWSGLSDLTAQCDELMPGMTVGPRPEGPRPAHCPGNQPVTGRAYGLELLLRRPLSKRLGGMLSYALSRSTRESHFATPAGGDVVATVPSEGDRTHVLNAMVGYDLGRRWRAGARFVYLSGQPYSPMDGSFAVPPYNSLRNPAFFRIDVRLEKRWSLGKNGSLAFVLEGQNVTLSKETAGMDCMGIGTPTMSRTTCKPGTIGPITIPSLGLEAFF